MKLQQYFLSKEESHPEEAYLLEQGFIVIFWDFYPSNGGLWRRWVFKKGKMITRLHSNLAEASQMEVGDIRWSYDSQIQ